MAIRMPTAAEAQERFDELKPQIDKAKAALAPLRVSQNALVDGAVQVVDAGLERDGEVDEVALAAAQQHLLPRADRADTAP